MSPGSRGLRAARVADAMLVERAIEGDDEAFSELFRRHSAYIARLAYSLLGGDVDVDDVVQDTFVRATDGLARLRDPARVRAWLATIAVRQVHVRLRRRTRWQWLARELEIAAPLSSDPSLQEQTSLLYHALSQITPDLRIPWMLYRIEGQSHAEIAVVCEISIATVKRRIADAQERIDRRLHGGR